MIASQTTLIRTYGTDGEFGNDNGSKNGNKKLTKEQAADLKSKAGLEKNPYILIFGAGHTSYKGSADEEKMYHVYCAIYQETKRFYISRNYCCTCHTCSYCSSISIGIC